MKLKNILIICFLAGCTTKENKTSVLTKTDSLLIASDSVIINANISEKILDSVTDVTTKKVKDNVENLTNIITNYEIQLKTTTKTKIVEKVIHDTVYIETKKSFWGKTKKTMTTASDSSINETEKIDTTKY